MATVLRLKQEIILASSKIPDCTCQINEERGSRHSITPTIQLGRMPPTGTSSTEMRQQPALPRHNEERTQTLQRAGQLGQEFCEQDGGDTPFTNQADNTCRTLHGI